MTENKTKNRWLSLITAAIVYFAVLFICVAMFLPRNVGDVYVIDESPEASFGMDDIYSSSNCELSYDGTYVIKGEDPYIIFKADNTEAQCLRVSIASDVEQEIPFQIYTALDDQQFSAENVYSSTVFKGEQSSIVVLEKGQYVYYRLDIDYADVRLLGIELFDEMPSTVPYKPDFSAKNYLAVILIPIVLAAVVWLSDRKFSFVERACGSIKANRSTILKVAVIAISGLLAAALIELSIGLVTGGALFNVYRWLFIAGIVELVLTFVFGFKSLKDKPENLFLPIVLILGIVMLFCSPIQHICWDFDSHYKWAVHTSYPGGTTYMTKAYKSIEYVNAHTFYSDERDYEQDIERLNEEEKIFCGETESDLSLAHLPSAVFIAVARFFNASFSVKCNLGRLANILLYSFLCFFAVKKIKSGKMIISVICLLPTSIFLATNYAYDWWVTGFLVLGTAYFVSELQEPDKPISVKDTVIMSFAFALGALPKLVYIIPMGMLLFMRKNWSSKKERIRYYRIIIAVFAVVLLMFMMKSMVSLGSAGDTRGGNVGPRDQVYGMLLAPIGYAKLLLKFLAGYLSIEGMQGYVSFFAYLGYGSLWLIPVILICFTTLTDESNKISFKIPVYMRALSVILFVGMSALIATALYISFTPVGLNAINGCQPRYIIPLLAPLLLLLTGKRLNIIKNKTVYNGVVLALMSFTVMSETYSVMLTKVM